MSRKAMPVTFGHYYTAKMNLFSPKNAALSPKMILFFLYLSKNSIACPGPTRLPDKRGLVLEFDFVI